MPGEKRHEALLKATYVKIQLHEVLGVASCRGISSLSGRKVEAVRPRSLENQQKESVAKSWRTAAIDLKGCFAGWVI
jgi:hypothetical protein